VHLSNYGRNVIPSYMNAPLKEVWGLFNLRNIFFQKGSIENTKCGA
jgi:hypothetical protein